MKTYDFIIVGAGIVGLTTARALLHRRYGSVLILEKESELGQHASGRNSGVLHTGIYYSANSLKARVCAEGAKLLRNYALEHGIQIRKTGKVIVATEPEAIPTIDILLERAKANGATVEKIGEAELKRIEPEAKTYEVAIFSPETSVIDAKQVLSALEEEVKSLGGELIKSSPVNEIDLNNRAVKTESGSWIYGHLINAAGLHADQIAHRMGVGRQYRILPFKGIYRKLKPNLASRFRGSIYPTPNPNMPFLGVHFTKTIHDEVLVGPTAIPAFGRENYGFFDDLNPVDSPRIIRDLALMFTQNKDGFRKLIKEESARYWPPTFLKCAQTLVPSIRAEDFMPGETMVGLRAQLIDSSEMKLVMDFVIKGGPHSTHILNAISPAFTGSLAFAELVADRLNTQKG